MRKVYTIVGEVTSSSSGRQYTIKEDQGGNLSCNCPRWIFLGGAPENRICKHIREYLGNPTRFQPEGGPREEIISV